MDIESIKRRFRDEIRLRGYQDKFISTTEEREVLQIALQMSVTLDSARAALKVVCDSEGYLLESAAEEFLRKKIDAALADDGKLDRAEFDAIVSLTAAAFAGTKDTMTCQRMVIAAIDAHPKAQIKHGWFSDWYAQAKREAGV